MVGMKWAGMTSCEGEMEKEEKLDSAPSPLPMKPAHAEGNEGKER